MRIMLDQSPKALSEKSERFDFDFWQLQTPISRRKLAGVPYGLDNGCFTGKLEKAWFSQLEDAEIEKPVFVALPDVVGSARRTMDLFTYFERRTNGLPRALVLQDGIGDVSIPWSLISAVFVGGSDAFKISTEAIQACRCAKLLDKWVHVGRVNEPGRLRNWLNLADSIDGSGISRYDHMLEPVVRMVKGDLTQLSMEISI